jgi:hypothetical protein
MDDRLLDLEIRICDLEIKRLKMDGDWTRVSVTRKAPAPTTAKVPLELRVSNQGAKSKYELRTATGWQLLPSDRSTWPVDARQMQDEMDAFYKNRTVNGRLVSAAPGTCNVR